ncbi:MAG: hypothetical protein LBV75_03535 [Paludibacter sp.]|jgi:hypothetical protein|nr:hypothetical protein [Paludibacter sp.]
MKKLLTYIFSVTFALYFLLAGTGYNISQFCCPNCKSQGIEAIINKNCKKTLDIQANCCSHSGKSQMRNDECAKSEQHCSFVRLQVETPSHESSSEIAKTPVSQIILFCSFGSNQHDCLVTNSAEQCRFTDKPPLIITGRQLLAFKSLLLI